MKRPPSKAFLDDLVDRFNQPAFIELDPISIPHRFSKLQDIEISGVWTAILSWGLRKTIISKALELCNLMDDAPYDFIMNHQERDLKRFMYFKHRTFNATDAIYFVIALRRLYMQFNSLEEAFSVMNEDGTVQLEKGIQQFRDLFFNHPDAPRRTQKHISSPLKKSTCKRINMFLRWMVRKDARGVDFGLWNRIPPSSLFMPLDIHVETQAKKLGLLGRKQRDWQAVLELTNALKKYDPVDPVRYDFALFGLGIHEKSFLKNSNSI